MPDEPPRRPWYALDPLNVLTFCLFVMVVEAIGGIAYYRRHIATIPAIGAAARMGVEAPAYDMPCDPCDETDETIDLNPTPSPTRETPEETP